jgi:antitoxin Phd
VKNVEININGLIPIEKVLSETEDVLETLDDIGKVVILKDNKPAYILLKYEEKADIQAIAPAAKATYTLQEAMKIVLSEVENKTLHASELADIIYDRKLYVQKNGEKAKYNQLRARCGHYPDMFEALPGNYIRLREGVK